MAKKFQKMMMVPVDDPQTVDWFKGQLQDDPVLTQAAKLATRQKKILDNPRMKPAEKTNRLQQLEIPFRKLLKRLRGLPRIGASAADDDEDDDDDEGDLVTTREQKLLSTILKGVTPKRKEKRPSATPPPTTPATTTPKKPPKRRITRTQAAKQLPFFKEEDIPFGEPLSAERVLRRARKRVKRTPLAQSRIRTAPGWQDWDQQGVRKRLRFQR